MHDEAAGDTERVPAIEEHGHPLTVTAGYDNVEPAPRFALTHVLRGGFSKKGNVHGQRRHAFRAVPVLSLRRDLTGEAGAARAGTRRVRNFDVP